MRILINSVWLSLGLIVGGCSTIFPDTEVRKPQSQPIAEQLCVDGLGQLIDCRFIKQSHEQIDAAEYQDAGPTAPHTHTLYASDNSVLVSEYIEQMAAELLNNLSVPIDQAVVGVTSFVEFSEDLSSVNHFGNMLAENFMFELQRIGLPVVDYKVAGGVAVTRHGDFVFSRNPKLLNLVESMQYVLTGTMTYNKRGLIVNARMVNYLDKRIIASSQKVIPYFVLDSIIPSSNKNVVIGE